ncbi:hypothetical protein [Salinarchaeum sp. Harcht-Bsk1]|nr:hypothetical protein [Salinarchaeum sp. Harcht-Bsk1]
MSDSNGRMMQYLANNPRKIGVLFTLLLALSQVGSVAADGANGTTIV